ARETPPLDLRHGSRSSAARCSAPDTKISAMTDLPANKLDLKRMLSASLVSRALRSRQVMRCRPGTRDHGSRGHGILIQMSNIALAMTVFEACAYIPAARLRPSDASASRPRK